MKIFQLIDEKSRYGKQYIKRAERYLAKNDFDYKTLRIPRKTLNHGKKGREIYIVDNSKFPAVWQNYLESAANLGKFLYGKNFERVDDFTKRVWKVGVKAIAAEKNPALDLAV